MPERKPTTYRDLFTALSRLGPEQLAQTACVRAHGEILPIYSFEKVFGSDVVDDGQIVITLDGANGEMEDWELESRIHLAAMEDPFHREQEG